MLDVGERAELVLEQIQSQRIERAQGLQRDDGVALAILDFVHDGHSAATKAAADDEP